MSYSLSFSKAVLVVIFVADKIRQEQYEFLATSSISQILNIPKPTLVKILQSLAAEGIIETKEGKQGGIRMVRDSSKITILDIFNAVEKGKPLFQSTFDIHAKGKRPDNAQKVIQNLFIRSEDQMKGVLAQKTIAEILEEMN
ncbi:MAG: Rrf2 family transcriptional regulator [Bacteroidia bacterium]